MIKDPQNGALVGGGLAAATVFNDQDIRSSPDVEWVRWQAEHRQ